MKLDDLLRAIVVVFLLDNVGRCDELARGGVYSITEIRFEGSQYNPTDAPARDVEFWVLFRHSSGSPEHRLYGYWDGDGKGGERGNVFYVRFCPTKVGRWNLVKVASNDDKLSGQKEGDYVTATAPNHPGFWLVDRQSSGRRWYMRSDGSHPYIIGNTHYSFLSGYREGGKLSGNRIEDDIAGNAAYFQKLRFGISGDRYPNPRHKPFIDEGGQITEAGDYSHRPSANWFHDRVDAAVKASYERDLIADIILAGPDTESSRSTLRARHNGGDPEPFLKYMAARYGSFPNVWFCLCNEYEIKEPAYTEEEMARMGQLLRKYLPFETTPVSAHSHPETLWSEKFDRLPAWHDHHIIQKKLRNIAPAADIIQNVYRNKDGDGPRNKPTINDELSYQGKGDKHSERDTIESHLGAFLGGGYGSTGYKPANKEGHYFWGKFRADEHTAADNLQWLSRVIAENITFWKMQPGAGIFENLDDGFRGMAWDGDEYVLGTNKQRRGIVANLPAGHWTIEQHDIIDKTSKVLSSDAQGKFTFDSPKSRAVLFHLKKND
jgi:hypothetical protein